MTLTDTTTSPTVDTEREFETAQLGIEGMRCASCVARIERELHDVPGVRDATVASPARRHA